MCVCACNHALYEVEGGGEREREEPWGGERRELEWGSREEGRRRVVGE